MSAESGRSGPRSGPPERSWGPVEYGVYNRNDGSSLPTPRRGVARPEVPWPGASAASSETRRLRTPRKQTGRSIGYGAAFLALLAVAILCVTGFLVARIFVARPSPSLPPVAGLTPSPFPSQPGIGPTGSVGPQGPVRIALDPGQGYIGTLVVVSGEGWWTGEPVFVLLRSPQEGDGSEYAYAAAVADERGAFRTAFTFPNEARWIGQDSAEVIARGTRSGLQTSARFLLVAPTATPTLTPYPTLPPTDTPFPTDTPLPTNTPLPTATPTPEVVITDWRGEYFANPSLAGTPVLVRNDVAIDFNWGAGSPDPRIPADRFSVRWTRALRFREGLYELRVTVDDGVRLWMDGQLLIDEWHDTSLTTYSVTVRTSEGHHYLQIEYYEGLGGAMIQFSRERVKPATPTPPPTETPPPPPPPS
ncbi:MAG: PA14 domain-containing protein, partial [Candidatus Hadarchaeum sp.]